MYRVEVCSTGIALEVFMLAAELGSLLTQSIAWNILGESY